MIDRYTLPEMGAVWSEQNKFQKWLEVELAVCEVHAELGTIPRAALDEIKPRAKFSVQRINEIEKATNHDLVAENHDSRLRSYASRAGTLVRCVRSALTVFGARPATGGDA